MKDKTSNIYRNIQGGEMIIFSRNRINDRSSIPKCVSPCSLCNTAFGKG